jgi:hypothetical protein
MFTESGQPCRHLAHIAVQPNSLIEAMKSTGWRGKIIFYQDNHVELYDLKRDLGEQNDLAGSRPQQAAQLRQKLAAWRQAIGAQMMTPNPNYKPR